MPSITRIHSVVKPAFQGPIAQVVTAALDGLTSIYQNYIELANDSPFWYSERAQLGFFQQAARLRFRINELTMLQEFGSYEEDKSQGTGDLFLSIKLENKQEDALVESKFYTTESKSSLESSNDWISSFVLKSQKQLENYYTNDRKYFDKRTPIKTRLVLIAFEAFRDYDIKSIADKSRKFDKWTKILMNEASNGHCDFLSIYDFGHSDLGTDQNLIQGKPTPSAWRALAVYGKEIPLPTLS